MQSNLLSNITLRQRICEYLPFVDTRGCYFNFTNLNFERVQHKEAHCLKFKIEKSSSSIKWKHFIPALNEHIELTFDEDIFKSYLIESLSNINFIKLLILWNKCKCLKEEFIREFAI